MENLIIKKAVVFGLVGLLSADAFAASRGRGGASRPSRGGVSQQRGGGCPPSQCRQGNRQGNRQQDRKVDRSHNRGDNRQDNRRDDRRQDHRNDHRQDRRQDHRRDHRQDDRADHRKADRRYDRRDDRRDQLRWDHADRRAYRRVARRVERRDDRRDRRQDFRHIHHHHYGHVVIDLAIYSNHLYWQNYYSYWYGHFVRPIYIAPKVYIDFNYDMPAPGIWDYEDIINVSDNLEGLSKKVFENVDYEFYGQHHELVKDAFYKVVLASEYYADAVYDGDFIADSVYELFYLNEVLEDALKALKPFRGSASLELNEQIRMLEYYIDELQWAYRASL